MCGHACPCSRPMTRVGVVKSHDPKTNVIGVKIQMIGLRFVDVHPSTTYKPGDVVTVQATALGWELTDR